MQTKLPTRYDTIFRNPVVLVLAAMPLIVVAVGCKSESPAGRADSDTATSPEKRPPIKKARQVHAIQIDARVTDNLPLTISHHGHSKDDGIRLELGRDPRVVVSNLEHTAAKESGSSDYPRKLNDANFVVVERVVHVGKGLQGHAKRKWVSSSLPDPPVHPMPQKQTISINDSLSNLNDNVPWPQDLAWRMKGDALIVETGKRTYSLSAGEQATLDVTAVNVPVHVQRYRPAPVDDDESARHPEIVVQEFGEVEFSTSITITYHGRLRVEESQ